VISRNLVTRLIAGVLLSSIGVATALAQREGPPRPQQFGPDTTATDERFTGGDPTVGTTPVGLTCDAPSDGIPALNCHGFLASSLDGTRLDVTVRVPQTGGPHPLVVYIHGWGSSKSAGRKYDADLIAAGYTYLRYSTRGFGDSWGQTNFGDIDVEIADLKSLIGQVVDDPQLQADAGAVAVMGASYGGAHSWLAAVQPTFTSPGQKSVQIRTVVPVASGTDLLYPLAPNGRPNDARTPAGSVKLSYLNGLYVSGVRLSETRPYPNYPPYLAAWHTQVNATDPDYRIPTWQSIADGIQGYRSVYWQFPFWDRVAANVTSGTSQLPIFQIQGFTDDLFPIQESLRMLRALTAIDPSYPIATYFGDVGHPRAVNKSGEQRYILDSIVQWLNFFMKGVGTQPAFDVRAAITRPRDVPFDSADVIAVAAYDDLATGHVTHHFESTNVLTFDPANTSGIEWDPVLLLAAEDLGATPPAPPSDDVPGDVAVYEVPAAQLRAGGVMVAGEPTVIFVAVTLAHRVQFNVRVFDVSPTGGKQLVTRGTVTLDTGNPAQPIGRTKVTIPTYGNLWPMSAASTLRLEITNVDSPYITPSRVPSVTEISNVRLDIPTRG
jgi:hypothetical protein